MGFVKCRHTYEVESTGVLKHSCDWHTYLECSPYWVFNSCCFYLLWHFWEVWEILISCLLKNRKFPVFPSVKKRDHLTIWRGCTVTQKKKKDFSPLPITISHTEYFDFFPAEKFLWAVLTVSESRKYFLLNLKPVILRLFPSGRKDTLDGFPNVSP